MVMATYRNGMHNGKAAIIENKVGKGKVVVLGCDPGREAYSALALYYAKEAGVQPLAEGDPGVVIAPRKGTGDGLVIVNLTNETRKIKINDTGYRSLLSRRVISMQNLILNPYEVYVLYK
jgi:beta-galactosidase GanA